MSKPAMLSTHLTRGLREGALFVLGAVSIYMMLSLLSYNSNDPGWSHSRPGDQVANLGGFVGAWFADVFLYLFGYLAYLFPVMTAYVGWLLYRSGRAGLRRSSHHFVMVGLGFVLTVSAGAALATLHVAGNAGLPGNPGGILGELTGVALIKPFSFIGTTVLQLALFLTGVTLFTGMSWIALVDRTGRLTLALFSWLRSKMWVVRDWWQGRKVRQKRQDAVRVENIRKKLKPKLLIEAAKPKIIQSQRVEKEKQGLLFENTDRDMTLPSLSLLDEAEAPKHPVSAAALEATSRQVELKLKDFGIEVEVVAVLPGPVITRYELMPAPGVKVSQISNLAKDVARALSVASVRIVEVIAGKSVIGLEIPNVHREMVRLSEILRSEAYDIASEGLPLGLGKDISGNPSVVDLAKMPHLLVAGTTGSGKSVAINAMILSLLFNATPRDMRLIMIDPKMLELSIYDGIPHLLAPVVTDMKDAANALRWAVGEMERRYALMAALGVRNVKNFNRKVTEAAERGEPILDPMFVAVEPVDQAPELETLPYIVIIIDELADMMMVVGKKVEQLIARLAQKARAAGVHLVLATQRPSVDVLTGLIKANIPTRIAFQVSSKIDSRTILDQMGAEQLLGHGDMLYLPPGTSMPTRVHGAFVDDHEVHKVVAELKKNGEPDYLDAILNGVTDNEAADSFLSAVLGEGGGKDDLDPLFDEAVFFVTEARKVSISSVQRRLKVGYNRAARLVEEMERQGVVSGQESNGAREVLAPPPVAVD